MYVSVMVISWWEWAARSPLKHDEYLLYGMLYSIQKVGLG
jgi:hypothetical protein